jgi:hypothetical protein
MLSFQMHGSVDGTPVSAILGNGQLLVDEVLWARAALLVDMDEVFDCGDGATSVTATLDGSTMAVLVTLIRACDRITSADFALGT